MRDIYPRSQTFSTCLTSKSLLENTHDAAKRRMTLRQGGETPEKSGKKPQNTIHTVANANVTATATVC